MGQIKNIKLHIVTDIKEYTTLTMNRTTVDLPGDNHLPEVS